MAADDAADIPGGNRHYRGMASLLHIPTTALTPSLKTEWRSPLTRGMISFDVKKPLTKKENTHGQVYT